MLIDLENASLTEMQEMPGASSDFGESLELRNTKRGKVVTSDLRKITVRYTNTLQSYTYFKSFLINQVTVLT